MACGASQEAVAELRTAVQGGDVEAAKVLLRSIAFTRGVTFEAVYPACRDLLTVDRTPDTLSAVAYGLWETGIPPLPVPSGDFVDFLLSMIATCDHASVRSYALLMVSDCLACEYSLAPPQRATPESFLALELPPQLRALIAEILYYGIDGKAKPGSN